MKRSLDSRTRLCAALCVGLGLVGCNDDDNESPDQPPPVVNTPPTANAGADQVVAPGGAVQLDGSESADGNGSIAGYSWTQTSGSSVTLATSTAASPSFTAPDSPGTLTFQLTVTDNGGASHSDTVTVTVNAPPVADAGTDQSVSAGAAVSLNGGGADADGSIASLAWTQVSGPAVTLGNANEAAATFTAPAAAATLGFNLTVTDNHGATHSDTVTVSVLAVTDPPPITAPVIARHPGNPRSFEHGSALLFVAASGNDLDFEWRRASGTVVKTGPEPFLLLTNLGGVENDDCYYVVVSNDAGIATSEQGCLTVDAIEGELDPSDDPESGDDYTYAQAYGDALMAIGQLVAGPFTGVTGGGVRLGVPIQAGPPEDCHSGSYGGATIDGVMMSVDAPLPLGQHTITEAWNDCYTDPDDDQPRNGAIMVEYDFPQTFGVGTLTIHVSEPFFNGTVHATVIANDTGGNRSDDIEITIAPDFSAGIVNARTEHEISLERRYTNDALAIDEVFLNLHASLTGYDANGSVGAIFDKQGGSFHLQEDFGGGDDGQPQFTSSGVVVVGLGSYVLATLAPAGGPLGWGFEPLDEEDCPPDFVCVDPPTP